MMQAMDHENRVFTIGHSTHSIERFVELLRRHGVTAVADVRSVPYSRHQPQFNRESLKKSLNQVGIEYVFLGKELGARSDDPACYDGRQVNYRRLAQTALFREGLERVRRGRETYCVALMCAEREPLDCHRTLLVARELEAIGMPVAHILADGCVEFTCECAAAATQAYAPSRTGAFSVVIGADRASVCEARGTRGLCR